MQYKGTAVRKTRVVLLLVTTMLACSCSANVSLPKEESHSEHRGTTVIETWKKAVIHLEVATDKEHVYDRSKKFFELSKKLRNKEITFEEWAKQSSGPRRDIRSHGTSILVRYDSKLYLITARHVIYDEHSAKREFQEEEAMAASWPENMRPSLLKSAYQRASNKVFPIIFRVPLLDEVVKNGKDAHREFIMNMSADGPMSLCTFSAPEIDLAVISLNGMNSRFGDELLKSGYVPIDSEVITEQPSKEGVELFTIGYPSSTALIGQVNENPMANSWASSFFSLPVVSFGRASMTHDLLPFYWVDMSIYPGNSGGPVIENGELVGIVSQQASIPVDNAPSVRTRIPFGKIIKAKYILELLKVQAQQDNELPHFFRKELQPVAKPEGEKMSPAQ